ncbi:MAG TPA: phosphatase PAP2 family protein, partial [Rhizomicrobium sp.]|nr:phosphatase PAP2 family protein [Rhizomicrobium sp.]
GLVLLDAALLALGDFALDARSYALVAMLVAPLASAALWYDRARNEPNLSATLSVAVFLIVFPAAASLFSYLALTMTGPRIDNLLAAADLAIGFRWTGLMALAADHPVLNAVLNAAYLSVLPQTLLLLFFLGLRGRLEALYGLALALTFGAVITVAFWTAFPSFGAFSVFRLPPAVESRLGLVLAADYGRILTHMLEHGPGLITPTEIRGLVGFPSYHTLQALVLFWYARREPWLRWPSLALNLLVLAAIPVQGGHHLVDMFGGFAVTGAAIGLSDRAIAWAKRAAGAVPATLNAAPVIP